MVPEGPETKTQWFKDGKPIKVPSDKYDEKVVGNKRILVVKSASVEDQGQFACETPKFKSSANLQVTTKRKCVVLELQLNPAITDVIGPATVICYSLFFINVRNRNNQSKGTKISHLLDPL